MYESYPKAWEYLGIPKEDFLELCLHAALTADFGSETPYEWRVKSTSDWECWAVGSSPWPGGLTFHLKFEFRTPELKAQFLDFIGAYDEPTSD